MAKNKISEWSSTAASNTDIGGIDIAEGCAPSGINNAIRELMAQVKDQQTGTDADNFTVGGNLSVTGTTTATGAITANGGVIGNLTGNATTATTATTATNLSGTLAIANGGTGQTTAANAFTALKQAATDAATGVVELLTTAEHTTGTDTTRALTSAVARAANIVRATAQASTSGTSVDFTGIPSWVKRITVMFDGVRTSGTSSYIVQLGDSGGVETTGYLGCASSLGTTSTNGSASSTAGVTINRDARAADTYAGICTITNISGNAWIISSMLYDLNASNPTTQVGGGNKSISATLDRIRITTVNGTDTFDAGLINIMYE